jgi:hypothetical protein
MRFVKVEEVEIAPNPHGVDARLRFGRLWRC